MYYLCNVTDFFGSHLRIKRKKAQTRETFFSIYLMKVYSVFVHAYFIHVMWMWLHESVMVESKIIFSNKLMPDHLS